MLKFQKVDAATCNFCGELSQLVTKVTHKDLTGRKFAPVITTHVCLDCIEAMAEKAVQKDADVEDAPIQPTAKPTTLKNPFKAMRK